MPITPDKPTKLTVPAEVIVSGDNYRLKDRDLGRVPTTGPDET
jgi:hypothetical protein